MKMCYVTFGYSHMHVIDGTVFDRDCVAVFEAESVESGRKKAFDNFGKKFCMYYFGSEWNKSDIKYYLRDYIPLGDAESPAIRDLILSL
jgi:hypothetical protein